jgi:hypothetical protein
MSQIELTDPLPAATESVEVSELQPQVLDAPSAIASDDASSEVNRAESRRVGFRYLLQQILTSGPLLAIDLALLMAAITIAKFAVAWVGFKTGLDLSACFVPIAVGFVLISAELGLYPGIRLSPVEEFRRLSMAATSIFAVWVMSLMMITDGLSWDRAAFLAVAFALYLVALPIFRGTLRGLLARTSWWGFPTLVCGSDATAAMAHRWLANNRRLGMIPVGVIGEPEAVGSEDSERTYAGDWNDARQAAEARSAYWAVVAPCRSGRAAPAELIAEYLSAVPHVYVLDQASAVRRPRRHTDSAELDAAVAPIDEAADGHRRVDPGRHPAFAAAVLHRGRREDVLPWPDPLRPRPHRQRRQALQSLEVPLDVREFERRVGILPGAASRSAP